MEHKHGTLIEWLMPLGFIACAGWTIWHGPAYLMAFGGDNVDSERLALRYPTIDILDYISVLGVIVFAVLGAMTVRRAPMEYESWRAVDRFAIFLGRTTMMLVVCLTSVMIYEVIVRYVFEKPTLWANELSLWLAGFVFLLSGFYAMQQRSHIRIFLLYDMLPRWLQHVCDVISVTLICVFAFALVYGGYGESFQKLLRWETFGTAFDPPIPATLKLLVLIVIPLVALQSILNLITDWNKEPEIHSAADDIDEDELNALKKAVGSGETRSN